MKRFAFLVFVFGSLSVCYLAKPKITFTPASKEVFPFKSPSCDIWSFENSEKPAKQYTEVGIINFHEEWHRSKAGVTVDKAMPQIKARACQAGADAITEIHVTQDKRLEFAVLNVRVTAIRFKEAQIP
jgi:hypothetical protein